MRRLAPIALALAFLQGCGDAGNEVPLTGKLLQGGAPYKTPEGQGVTLALVAIEFVDAVGKTVKRPDTHQAALGPDGSFHVPGPEGRGIPPGKYRVSVTRRYTRVAFEVLKVKPRGMQRDDDLFQDRFGPTTSPIVREVRPGSSLQIDLDNPAEGAPAGT